MTVSTVVQGIHKCQVPYHNHTTGATQSNTVPEAIHFLSLGNSKIREQLDRIEDTQKKILEALAGR
jgi:hypothetical protein